MVKRTKQHIADEKNKFNDNRTQRVTDYTYQKTSNSNIHTTDANLSDDLIISLADAPENKRARQVIEWESLQRKAFYKTA